MQTYVAFLRGINVGGHHKVPMAELKEVLAGMGYRNMITILNSGNVIFDTTAHSTDQLESMLTGQLESHFGFRIPTIVRTAQEIAEMHERNPFDGIEVTKDIRMYITFLKEDVKEDEAFPWTSEDGSYRILEKSGKQLLSVLNLSVSNTPKAMEFVEKTFGKKNVTTRNWKTIVRIMTKLAG